MISTKTALLDTKGVELPLIEAGQKVQGSIMTIGQVVAEALLFTKSEDPLKAYIMGNKFLNETEIQLTATDIVFIQKALKGSSYTPLVVGQVMQMLDK